MSRQRLREEQAEQEAWALLLGELYSSITLKLFESMALCFLFILATGSALLFFATLTTSVFALSCYSVFTELRLCENRPQRNAQVINQENVRSIIR